MLCLSRLASKVATALPTQLKRNTPEAELWRGSYFTRTPQISLHHRVPNGHAIGL